MTNLKAVLNDKSISKPAPLVFDAPPQQTKNALVFDAPPKQVNELTNLLSQNLTLTTDIGDWEGKQLPDDAPELASALQASLADLQIALKSDDVATALYDTKVFIDTNPATKDLLMPEDINLFVKALQSSHSIVIAKKTTRKASKSVTNTKAEELAATLGDLGDFTL